jgi:hypothetical protein
MEEYIINAVHKREEIWNPRNSNHKNVNILKRIWMEITEEVGQDGKFLLLLFM